MRVSLALLTIRVRQIRYKAIEWVKNKRNVVSQNIFYQKVISTLSVPAHFLTFMYHGGSVGTNLKNGLFTTNMFQF